MDKLKLAHDYALKLMGRSSITIDIDEVVRLSFDLANAMQAEADKRESKERPDVLCEVDWSQAPKNAFQWQVIDDEAYWRIEIMGGLDTEPAPSFGFTGTHIVERPQ